MSLINDISNLDLILRAMEAIERIHEVSIISLPLDILPFDIILKKLFPPERGEK